MHKRDNFRCNAVTSALENIRDREEEAGEHILESLEQVYIEAEDYIRDGLSECTCERAEETSDALEQQGRDLTDRLALVEAQRSVAVEMLEMSRANHRIDQAELERTRHELEAARTILRGIDALVGMVDR